MNQNNSNQSNASGGAPGIMMPMFQVPTVAFLPQGQSAQGQGVPMQIQPAQQQAGMQMTWPQWPQMAFGGQQWLQPPLQGGGMAQMPSQLAQGSSQVASAADIAAAVVQAMRPTLQDTQYTPAGSDPQDEQILIDALKKGHTEGLTTRQAIEKLHNVNNHSQSSWKDFYLDHDKKLFPKIYSFLAISSSLNSSRNGASTSRSAGSSQIRPQLPRRTATNSSSLGLVRRSSDFYTRNRSTSPRRQQSSEQTKTARNSHDHSEAANSSPLPQRSRRGQPVDEYHAETYIPPFSGSKKPKPPSRVSGGDWSKFTDEDKIFLIHYLRWRVCQGKVPTKAEVFEELEKQSHHSADAWKRHWQQHAELPDRILAQAHKRYAEEHTQTESSSDEEEYGEEADDGKDDDDEDDDDDDDGRTEKPGDGHVRAPCRRRHITMGVKVTEDDLRAMAKYKAERLEKWSKFPSKRAAWEEFAARPGNKKRSLVAWITVARDRGTVLQEYLREYIAQEQESESSEEPTPPQQDDAGPSSSLGSRTPSRKAKAEAATPLKRPAATMNASEDAVPAAKRAKVDKWASSDLKPKEESIEDDRPEVVVIPRAVRKM